MSCEADTHAAHWTSRVYIVLFCHLLHLHELTIPYTVWYVAFCLAFSQHIESACNFLPSTVYHLPKYKANQNHNDTFWLYCFYICP